MKTCRLGIYTIVVIILTFGLNYGQINHELLDAVKTNQLDKVKQLAEKGLDLNEPDEDGVSLLMWATYKGDLETVKYLIGKKADYQNSKGIIYTDDLNKPYYGSLVGIAAGENKLDMLRYFIEDLKIDVDDREYDTWSMSKEGWTALTWSVYKGHASVTDYLLKKGADINAFVDPTGTALHFACYTGNMDMVNRLSAAGADFQKINNDGNTVLHSAVSNKEFPEIIKFLIQKGLDVNQLNLNGNSPLHFATQNNFSEVTKLLVASGADVRYEDMYGNTALHFAASKSNTEIIKLLIEKGADLNKQESNGYAPLHLIALFGTAEAAQALVDLGADTELRDNEGNTPMDLASSRSNTDVLNLLLKKGGNTNKESTGKLLMNAALEGDYETFERLLNSGADIRTKNDRGQSLWEIADANGNTVIHVATLKSNQDMIIRMIENGGDVNRLNAEGLSALHFAARNGDKVMAELLIKNKANINIPGGGTRDAGATPLMLAALNDQFDLFNYLLASGADFQIKNAKGEGICDLVNDAGRTFLQSAAEFDRTEIIRLLIDKGADINKKDPDGYTALHIALLNKSVSLAFILVEKGADLTIKNPSGETALDIALNNQLNALAFYMEDPYRHQLFYLYETGRYDEFFQTAIAHKELIEIKNKDNRTVFDYAMEDGNSDVFVKMSELLTNVNMVDPEGRTLLYRACMKDLLPIARLLLNKGADPNQSDAAGYAPLYFAEINKNKELESLLLQKGARESVIKANLMVPIGHEYDVRTIACSPDCKTIVSGSSDHSLILWDIETGKMIKQYSGHMGAVLSVAFSPDGSKIISGSKDGTVKLWDVKSGNCIRTLKGHTFFVTSVAFFPDGEKILSGSSDYSLKMWDAKSGTCLGTLQNGEERIETAALSPDGLKAVSGTRSGKVVLWDLKSKTSLAYSEHSGPIYSLAFSPDGTKIAGSRDTLVFLIDALNGKILNTFKGHKGVVLSVSFSQDGSRLISGSGDQTLKLWDVKNGACLRTFTGHNDVVYSACITPDGSKVLSGSNDVSIKIWETQSGTCLKTLKGYESEYSFFAFSPDSSKMLTVLKNATVEFRDLLSGKLVSTLAGHDAPIQTLCFSPDGSKLITGSEDKTIKIWDLYSGTCTRTCAGHEDMVNSVVFSPDGKQFVSGSNDQSIKLWDAETGKCIVTFTGHSLPVGALAFSPDGLYIASGSFDRSIRIWDVQKRTLLKSFTGHEAAIHSLEFSPDGTKILSGSAGNEVKLWDLKSGTCLKTYTELDWGNSFVRFSPDGSKMLWGWGNRYLKLLDIQSGKLIRLYRCEDDDIQYAEYTKDGKKIIGDCEGKSICIWDAETGNKLIDIRFFQGEPVVISPDGLFDSGPAAMNEIYFVSGLEIIELGQLKDRFYEPGLLKHIMNNEKLRDVQGFNDIQMPPEIELIPNNKGLLKINVINKMNGGIGKVKIYAGGKEILGDARTLIYSTDDALKLSSQKEMISITIDLTKYASYFIPGQMNIIRVEAYNSGGFIVSRPEMIAYTPPIPENFKQNDIPDVYIVCIGVSDYYGESIDLKFAAKDAEDMMTALMTGAVGLFGAGKVHTVLLTSPISMRTDINRKGLPDKKGIEEEFLTLSQNVDANDILIVYMAGHGINIAPDGGEGDFYYMTCDAYSSDISTYFDRVIREKTTIKSSEFVDMLLKQAANKQVLILDACHSGKAVENLSVKRDISSNSIRAFERMKDRTGMHIITGSTADAVSYESNQFGQGILTYSLLEGIKGMALREGRFVDVMQLFQNSKERVPVLAGGLGGIQEPVIFSPYLAGKYEKGAESFDIGIISNEDKLKIPLAKSKPMFVTTILMDSENFSDHLNLGDKTDEKLRELSSKGSDAPLILIDVKDFPGAFKIRGQYTVVNDQLILKVNIFEDKTIIKSFELTGKQGEPDVLIEGLIEKVTGMIRN